MQCANIQQHIIFIHVCLHYTTNIDSFFRRIGIPTYSMRTYTYCNPKVTLFSQVRKCRIEYYVLCIKHEVLHDKGTTSYA